MPNRPKECTLMKIIGSKYLRGSENSYFSSLTEIAWYSRKVFACQISKPELYSHSNTSDMVFLR